MRIEKASAEFTDRSLAMSTAGALQDLLEPPPDALSVFETGPGVWVLEAYFNDGVGARDLDAELGGVLGEGLPTLARDWVPELNWVAMSQAALPPVAAGRFIIHGTHDIGRVARGPGAILIDAGEAFGTAHHATTHGCLLAIDRLTRSEAFDTVLDLGCGSGVLAIAMARAAPNARIIATDLDPQSVKVAAENMRVNGVGQRIATTVAAGVDHTWLRQSPPFDLIIANILAGPLVSLAKDIRRTLRRGGTLVLSGLLIPQAPEVIAAYRAQGFRLERHDRITGWSTLTLRRTA